jgi:hypothetical protein
MNMKRFVVEQTGMVQIEVTRQFMVEVPDHFTEDQTEELLHHTSLPDEEGMEWTDELQRQWVAYDVEIDTTCAYDPDPNAASEDGLKVISWTALSKGKKPRPS